MDSCNGHIHSWMDDSYDYGSYPCPGYPECQSEAVMRQRQKEVTPMSIPSSAGVTVEIKVPVTLWCVGQRELFEPHRADYAVSTTGSRIRFQRVPQGRNGEINVIELDKNGLEAAIAMLGTLQDVI